MKISLPCLVFVPLMAAIGNGSTVRAIADGGHPITIAHLFAWWPIDGVQIKLQETKIRIINIPS